MFSIIVTHSIFVHHALSVSMMGWVGICVTKSENILLYPAVKHMVCVFTLCVKRNIETIKIPVNSACLQYVYNNSHIIIFIR